MLIFNVMEVGLPVPYGVAYVNIHLKRQRAGLESICENIPDFVKRFLRNFDRTSYRNCTTIKVKYWSIANGSSNGIFRAVLKKTRPSVVSSRSLISPITTL